MIEMLQRKPAGDAADKSSAAYHEMLGGAEDIAHHLAPAVRPGAAQAVHGGGEDTVVLNGGSTQDSWKNMMARNLGREVVISSLVGSHNTVVAQGTLYEVGSDYVTLYHPERQSLISTDIYAIRYIEFLPQGMQGPAQSGEE